MLRAQRLGGKSRFAHIPFDRQNGDTEGLRFDLSRRFFQHLVCHLQHLVQRAGFKEKLGEFD